MLEAMAARTRVTDKRPLERLHERIKTGDRGWFFANIADKVAEQRLARNLSQRELAELCGTTQSAIARLDRGGRPPLASTERSRAPRRSSCKVESTTSCKAVL